VKNSGTLLIIMTWFGLSACGQEAFVVQNAQDGGIVAYSVTRQSDVLTSPGRRAALDLIKQKCKQGWRVVREGEIARVRKSVDRAWRDQIDYESRWGIQFSCE